MLTIEKVSKLLHYAIELHLPMIIKKFHGENMYILAVEQDGS